ncbi:MAG: glycosyl transferase family 2 [Candidatus Rokubacteria bacterium]|nr:glycosyl transferase family 2 [Candidatus Rokubacteria bacterium]
MTATAETERTALDAQVARAGTCEIAVVFMTYNNADTLPAVLATTARGLTERFTGASVAYVAADAGSSDGTPDLVAAAGAPSVVVTHEPPLGERVAVPFHGVPGRGAALRGAFAAAKRLGARAVLLLEPDLISLTPDWIDRLLTPVWNEKADFVAAAYARHRFDGTITNLLVAPLVRALYGRRVRQPLGGQQALSGRLVDHLLVNPKWDWAGRELADVWILGTAIADGFSVWEAWLGPRAIRSRTRTSDLPAMVSQTLGGVLAVMDRHDDLWREVRGSEPLPAVGEPRLPGIEPREVDVERMASAFQLGLRDLTPVWEHVLAPETLGDVLSLEAADLREFRFPDDLWARVVYDFALGHHYAVIHREHLLRSLVPLYLGRTAAYVLATRGRSAAASEEAAENVARAFERQKAYLVERWT